MPLLAVSLRQTEAYAALLRRISRLFPSPGSASSSSSAASAASVVSPPQPVDDGPPGCATLQYSVKCSRAFERLFSLSEKELRAAFVQQGCGSRSSRCSTAGTGSG